MKRTFQIILLWLCTVSMLLLPTPARAGNPTLFGRVYETMKAKVYAGTRVTLGSVPLKETITDENGNFWFRDVAPGAYLVRIQTPAYGEVTARLVVFPNRPVAINDLDLSRILAPDEDDNY
jgi:Carboxypeptidase regulatory-like domain